MECDVLLPRAYDARRDDCILRPERLRHLLNIQTHPRQTGRGKGQNHLFLLFTQQGGFADIRQGHQFPTQCLHPIPNLPQGIAFGDEAINCAERVVKFVVDIRALNAFWQRRSDILHFLPHLVPDIRHRLRRRIIAQVDMNNGASCPGFAFDIIKPGDLL